MSTYRILWEVDIEADTPEEAARKAQEWMDEGDTGWVYDVKDMKTGETVSIDMAEVIQREYEEQEGPQE